MEGEKGAVDGADAGPHNRGWTKARPVESPEHAHLGGHQQLGAWVVDGHDRESFAAAHVPGSINIELDDAFATYVGWIVPFGAPLILILPGDSAVVEAATQLLRIGYEQVEGYAAGGMTAWEGSGMPVGSYPVMHTDDLVAARRSPRPPLVLDVRQPREWESGVIPGSQTVFVGDLGTRLGEIPRDREVWVICASGRRAAIAASLLDGAGITVRLVAREGVGEWLERFDEKEVRTMASSLKEMIQEARAHVRELPPKDVAAALEQEEIDLLVDVREPEEWSRGHIPGSVNIPRGMLEIRADPASRGAHQELSRNRDARIVVYCLQAPSARSLLAAQTLDGMGYTNVSGLEGGLLNWREQGLPLEPPAAR